MYILYAIFLGLLQGATEFLPVSSSGHLVIAESFFDIQEASLTFDVALHMGTLLAVVAYFRKDLWAMLTALLRYNSELEQDKDNRKIAYLLIAATIPAVIAGLFLEDLVAGIFRNPGLVAVNLVVFGGILLWADRSGKQARRLHAFTIKDALLVGVAQALAIIPGVSRSGITMTAGLFREFDRQAAARFSFLMSIPVIAGAGFLNVIKIISMHLNNGQLTFYLCGFLVSAISGYLFIAFLMKYIQTRSFAIFAYYRFILAGAIVLGLLL